MTRERRRDYSAHRETSENSLDYSLHNTLRGALFLPTTRAVKYKAKAAIDTFFFRMGDVIAGLGIVFPEVHPERAAA